MENMGIKRLSEELRRLNPEVKFDIRDTSVSPIIIIYGNVPGSTLNLPSNYYFDERRGITNKNSGIYESFTYQFDTAHFEQKHTEVKPKEKKSLFRFAR